MEQELDYALTTLDNPYDPFEQDLQWFRWDVEAGYNTCGLLAKKACTSQYLTDEDNERLVLDAMHEIVKQFPGLYTIRTKELIGEGGP